MYLQRLWHLYQLSDHGAAGKDAGVRDQDLLGHSCSYLGVRLLQGGCSVEIDLHHQGLRGPAHGGGDDLVYRPLHYLIRILDLHFAYLYDGAHSCKMWALLLGF